MDALAAQAAGHGRHRGAAGACSDPGGAGADAHVHARLLSARKQQLLLQQRQIADSPQKEWGTKDQGLVGSGTPEQVDGELMQIQEAEALASEAAALQLQLGLEGAEERPAMSISELATGGGESQLKTNARERRRAARVAGQEAAKRLKRERVEAFLAGNPRRVDVMRRVEALL